MQSVNSAAGYLAVFADLDNPAEYNDPPTLVRESFEEECRRFWQEDPAPITTNLFSGADETIACSRCGESFTFTVQEQEFYTGQGFIHPPKTCKRCRQRRSR